MPPPATVFVCSGLEPGRDGVGDYTRCLAGELFRRGHRVGLVAMNDSLIDACVQGDQEVAGVKIGALRLPRQLPWGKRTVMARKWIEAFNPDWISLQFVCYGFDSRGLVFGLARRLREVIAGRPLQAMMHETWIGEDESAGIRERALGFCQRRLVLSLLKSTRVRVVHTHSEFYVDMLRRDGVPARKLPLFSSIPVRPAESAVEAGGILRELGWPVFGESRESLWVFSHFGTLHPEFEAAPMMDVIRSRALERRKKCLLLIVGRMGGAGEAVLGRLRREHGSWAGFLPTGELDEASVSALLNASDFGITETPPESIEKSSSVAALLDHGLPVLVGRQPLRWRRFRPRMPSHPLLAAGADLARFDSIARGRGDPGSLGRVADLYLSDLLSAN